MRAATKIFIFLCFNCLLSFSQEFKNSEQIDQIVNARITNQKISGAVILVQYKGKTIHHKAYGKQDIQDNIAMDTSSIFRIYSMTKPITSLSAMILVDRGLISLEDPIEKYLHELKDVKVLQKGKLISPISKITIRDLLRHTAGFAYGFGLGASKVDFQYNKDHPLISSDYDEMIKKLSTYPIKNHPGEKYSYSLSVDVLGAIIERVSNKSLYEFMKENIFLPLDMRDTHFKLPKEKTTRFTSIYGPNLKVKDSYKNSKYRLPNRLESGGGGLISTSSDYLKFACLILNKGIHNGDTLVSPKLILEMTKNQLPDGEGVFKLGGDVAIGFGLGFSVYLKEWGYNGHKGDFGWSGIGNTHFYCSPKEDLVVIIMSQRMPISQKLVKELKPVIYKGLVD